MRSKEGFNIGKRNGCSLINNNQIRVAYLVSIIREHKLHELSMPLKDIYSQHCSIVILVVAVYLIEVLPLLEV